MQIFSIAHFKCPFYHVPKLCSFIAWKAILRRDNPWQLLCGRDDRCSQLRQWKQTSDTHRAWWSGKTISDIWKQDHQVFVCHLNLFKHRGAPFWMPVTSTISINWRAVNTCAAVIEFCRFYTDERRYDSSHTLEMTNSLNSWDAMCSPWWWASEYRNMSEFTYIKTLLWY